MADYAARPTKAKEDQGIIELRKRMLAVFLNRCRGMKEVLEDGVWWRFLDPNASWVRLYLHSRSARANRPKERGNEFPAGHFDSEEHLESLAVRPRKL